MTKIESEMRSETKQKQHFQLSFETIKGHFLPAVATFDPAQNPS